jgi:subtilisin family serine protease
MTDGGHNHDGGDGDDGDNGEPDGNLGEDYHPPLPEEYAEAFPGDHRRGYYFKTGEILVAAADVPVVSADLAERGFRRREEPSGVTGVVVFANDEDAEVPRIVDELRAKYERAIVYPHHVAHVESHAHAGPFGLPSPAGPLEPLPRCCEPGAGVLVGVLDTGAVDHAWYRGRVDSDKSDLEEQPGPGGVEQLDTDAGHGTFIAGVILQHAPGARVIARAVCDGNGWLEDLKLAVNLATIAPLVNILNLSLCGLSHDDSGMLGTEVALDTARRANPDLVVVAAAGNNRFDRPTYPAAYKRVIGVAAVQFDRPSSAWRRAVFSNYGWWVDASAPGVDVHSTYLDYDGQLSDGSVAGFEHWARWSGTSFATPRVAGAIAAAMTRGVSAHEVVYRMIDAPWVARQPDIGVVIDPLGYA